MSANELLCFLPLLWILLLCKPTFSTTISSCQTVFQSCNSEDVTASNQSKGAQDVERKRVTITTIIPLSDCYTGTECQVVDFRLLDVVGLQLAIKHLPPPANYCVEIELCDSYHDPIKAASIVGAFNFRESCDQNSCTRDQVCFTQCFDRSCKNHVAVIGPGTPREGKALADLTSALEIPQVLYSTGSLFSESDRYKYLHKVAPHYQLQADKIVDIIFEMEWRYVAVLTTTDTYGKIGKQLLQKKFDILQSLHEGVEKNYCLQFSTTMLTFKMEHSEIEAQLKVLEEQTTVIVIWMEGRYATNILDYFERSKRNETVYIASDGWSLNSIIHDKFKGILRNHFIGVFPVFGEILQDGSTDELISFNNKDCHEFYDMDKSKCDKVGSFIRNSKMFGYSGGIIASLGALYSALDTSDTNIDHRKLRQHLNKELKKTLTTRSGDIRVYTLSGDSITLAENRTAYPQDIVSRCSEPCQTHQYKVILKKRPRCCFTCKSCSVNSIVQEGNKSENCYVCDKCKKPNGNHSVCIAKEVEQFSILNGDAFSVTVFLVSVLGIFCNMFVLASLVRNSHTPIVKASSPELCYIMLVSLMLLLTAPILMVSGPGDLTCPLQRYIIGIGIVIPIAVLFARANRINVIFNRTSLLTSSLQKMIMSVKYNVIIIAFFAVIQICICVILQVHHERTYHENSETKMHVKILCNSDVTRNNFMMCNEDRMDVVYMWIGYVCAMILATTVVAFKTRRLPTNFNEARYICLVMFVVIVLTITTVATYIVLDSRANIMYQCWSIIIAVYAILTVIYGQKMYVIYVIPDRNRHQDTNIALDRFIKQNSDQRLRSYSQLLIRPSRTSTIDMMTRTSTTDMLSRASTGSTMTPTNCKPSTPTSRTQTNLSKSISVESCPPIRAPALGSPVVKLTASERRARYRQSGAVSEEQQIIRDRRVHLRQVRMRRGETVSAPLESIKNQNVAEDPLAKYAKPGCSTTDDNKSIHSEN